MAVTQQDLVVQMLAQLRMLDPSISAEVGTPERKIIDSVGSALADAQVDLTQLQGALDIDTKTGSNLDNFLALFGFGRQQAVRATGFVTFSRFSPATIDIYIPAGTQVLAKNVNLLVGATDALIQDVIYETTFETVLLAGQSEVIAPVRALIAGADSNLAAGRITSFATTTIFGIESITNPAPITGGIDREDDDQLKVRFKNTVFRNLAGTQDQFVALALSAAYTKKVNVVGPISRYREYVQVPPVDDATSYNVNPQETGAGSAIEAGNGLANQYSTALSTIPYSKHTYSTVPNFISNGQTGVNAIFWREDIDYRINYTDEDKNRGDAYRFAHTDIGDPDLQLGPDPLSAEADYKPGITFFNVVDNSVDPAVTAIRKGDTLLFEHSYMSEASRNDWTRNISNCVDVFIDGSNDTVASTIVPTPGVSTAAAFVDDPASKYYRENYRRSGEPDAAPTLGNLFFPMFWQPVTGVPSEIIIQSGSDTAMYFLGEHYWLVEDNTELFGTIRARNGIEFNANINGALSTSDVSRSALRLNQFAANTPMEINSYLYDKNVVDLQTAMEAAKQVTTDVLVHRSRVRYFKLDITVMYGRGVNSTVTNNNIRLAVQTWFAEQFFGNAIQLSDILSTIHSVSGVDNVRWSSDVPGNTDIGRMFETGRDGTERVGDEFVIESDFFIKDDELPRLSEDTTLEDETGEASREWQAVPGLRIRTRAQNTWISA